MSLNKYHNFEIVISVNGILRNLLLSFIVVWKYVIGDEDQVLLILWWLLPTSIMKGNAEIELKVSENKEVNFFQS